VGEDDLLSFPAHRSEGFIGVVHAEMVEVKAKG